MTSRQRHLLTLGQLGQQRCQQNANVGPMTDMWDVCAQCTQLQVNKK